MTSHLYGLNDGSFTYLEVLKDGAMENILDLVGGSGSQGPQGDQGPPGAALEWDIGGTYVPVTKLSITNATHQTNGTGDYSATVQLSSAAQVTGLQNLLDDKQDVIDDDDLAISHVANLQGTLTAKATPGQLPQIWDPAQGTWEPPATEAPLKLSFLGCGVVPGAGSGHYVVSPDAPSIADVEYGLLTTQLATLTTDVAKANIGSTTGGGSYASVTNSAVNTSTTSTFVSTSLRFGTTGHIYPNPAGSMADTTNYDVVYDIPAAYRGGSVWLSHSLDQNGGYFDVYLRYTGYTTGNEDIFYKRVNSQYPEGYMRSDAPDGTKEYAGQRLVCVASAYASHFDQVVIKGKKGRYYIIAVSFSENISQVDGSDWIHSDNIIGDPDSLSDTRIKDNQAVASQDSLCRVFDAVSPKTYDRQDGDTTAHRLGFIANDVQQALNIHLPDVTNIISERPVGNEHLLALDYSRLVCVLWAKVRQLEQRLEAREAL